MLLIMMLFERASSMMMMTTMMDAEADNQVFVRAPSSLSLCSQDPSSGINPFFSFPLPPTSSFPLLSTVTMSTSDQPRRKGPKALPKLPLSVFTPPNSGTSDRFPLPPSPSAVHPTSITDAQVLSSDIEAWKARSQGDGSDANGKGYGRKAEGVVVVVENVEGLKGWVGICDKCLAYIDILHLHIQDPR
jgi:hypothetical protein